MLSIFRSSKRLLAAALTIGMSFSLPAMAEPIPLGEISRYINSIATAEARFTQTAGGQRSSGRLLLSRPGRMRFEYDAPHRNLVLATSGSVVIFDHRSNSEPASYPLARTPLNLILAPQVDLARAGMVIGHREEGGRTLVTAQDPAAPANGRIELIFERNPTRLAGWITTDDMGAQTRVTLQDLRPGVAVNPSLFALQHELDRRGLTSNH